MAAKLSRLTQNSDTTASRGRERYHLQFLLQVASPETFGYTIVFPLQWWVSRSHRFTGDGEVSGTAWVYLLEAVEKLKIPPPAGDWKKFTQPMASHYPAPQDKMDTYLPKARDCCYYGAIVMKPRDVGGRGPMGRAAHLRAGGIRETENRGRFQ
jgi:hypothetical protein